MWKSGTTTSIASILCLVLFSACGASDSESDVSLYVQPSLFGGNRVGQERVGRVVFADLLNPIPSWSGENFAGVTDLTPPVTCVGLNVMGANIPSSGSDGSTAWNQYRGDVLAGDTCSYPGKVSNVVSVNTGGVISVKIPFGSDRVIQLVGYSGINCNQAISGSKLSDPDQVAWSL